MRRLRGLATAALAVGGGAIVIGQLGRIWAPPDWLNHFFPLWIVVTLAGCAGLLRDRSTRWRRAGLIVAAVVLVPAVISYLREAASHSDGSGGSVAMRLVQFNVFKANSRPEAAARWILDQRADVVVLEEAADDGGKVRGLLSARYPHAVDCVGQQARCSTVILTTQAPVDSGGLARGDPENQNGLSAAWLRLSGPARRATIVGVHLGRPWPFADQTWQIGELADFLRTSDRDYAIVAGDFNQSPWTFAMRRQDRAIGLHRITGDRASWPLRDIARPDGSAMIPSAVLSIDHVYVGRCWARSSVHRGPWLGSDHAPLVIELKQLCPEDRSNSEM